jgi:two-component system phosphate regulon sensor histidine kinase PhoR
VKRKKRLLWQLYPSYLLITLVSVLAATWFASRTLKQFFLDQSALDLQARAHLLERQILEYISPLDEKAIDQFCKKSGDLATTRITVILPSGRVIGDSVEDPAKMDNHVDRPEVIQALNGQTGTSTRFSPTLQRNMMYIGIPLKNDSNIIGVVRTSVPLTSIDEAIKNIQLKIAIGGLLIAVFAAVVSLLVSRRISSPIEEIRKSAESFARGDFQRRLPAFSSEEIGGLSDTMNQMAVELHERINTITRQRNELEAVLSSMAEAVIAVDTEERIISMNQTAAQMFACNPSEVQGRSIQEVIRNTVLHKFVTDALSSEESFERDIVLYSDGELILNGHGTTLSDSDGNRVGALVVLNDVTRLKRLESIRREFVANVSHEIKTPITAIKGFVETLQDGAMESPEDAGRFLGIIEKHVDRLDTIIEDLLSLSRIERDVERDEIILHEGHIRDVLQAAIQLCEVKAAPKDIRMELSCDEDLRAKIDAPLLEQAVVNLLDNAIKYSDVGSAIWVESTRTAAEIIINVRDKGRGIARDHLPRVFERFYRVDKARSRELGGTGLGLAIVKHIAQAHGGRVDVESSPGKGSTFSLYLPGVGSGD